MTPVLPTAAQPPDADWATAVIACALRRCQPEQIRPQYTTLVQHWQELEGAAMPVGAGHDVERAARRLADIVTGAAPPQTLIGDPQLAPEAMLLRETRLRVVLDDLTDRIFAHARMVGRRVRIMEVGARTGLITQRLTDMLGAVVEEYLCFESNPVLTEIAAGRGVSGISVPIRHVDMPHCAAVDIDVVICCGSLHQLPDAHVVFDAITVSNGGWLWVAENSDITPATLVSAAVLDPGLLSAESATLRSADQWWRFIADHGWQPTQMTQDGPGLTIIARRPDVFRKPRPASHLAQRDSAGEPRPHTPARPALVDESIVATIAEIWRRHLAVPTPTAADDFFLLGGDS
ncbi:MAG: non-ribosomal peptide synthetase, partial [Mycobacterium sp.]